MRVWGMEVWGTEGVECSYIHHVHVILVFVSAVTITRRTTISIYISLSPNPKYQNLK